MIGPAPQMGPFVAPGNNYHVYDIPLFWANIRADFARRVGHGTASGRMTIPLLPKLQGGARGSVDFHRRSRHARCPARRRRPDRARPWHTDHRHRLRSDWRIASPGKTIARGKFSVDKVLIEELIAERSTKGSSSACR
jgi:hypothetical protein